MKIVFVLLLMSVLYVLSADTYYKLQDDSIINRLKKPVIVVMSFKGQNLFIVSSGKNDSIVEFNKGISPYYISKYKTGDTIK